ncbi:MAG: DinB family protein, partial [Acidimicrobiales bacterium]
MSAAALVAANEALDKQLIDALEAADLSQRPFDPEEWVPIEVAAHVAEFPLFFAGELRRWREDPRAVVGRSHDDRERIAAVAEAGKADPQRLLEQCRAAIGVLAKEIARFSDTDVTATTVNVKYGSEPMTVFLERYVLGHKAGHIRQLADLSGNKASATRPTKES